LMQLPDDVDEPYWLKKYQGLVGSLIWLYKTRPDMMFTINLLCRFLKCATQQHYVLTCGRPLRYLKGSASHGIVFKAGEGKWELSGVSDSDLAGDLKSARSTIGCVMKLGEFGAVMCSSTLERKISTSTGQAETYGLQSLVKEAVWERHFLSELGLPLENATSLKTDNQGVQKQTIKAINHATAKHYRIAQAYIRSKCKDRTVRVGYVNTNDNDADIFTKALHAPAFLRHRAAIMGPQMPGCEPIGEGK
jgi:hypothetical protein